MQFTINFTIDIDNTTLNLYNVIELSIKRILTNNQEIDKVVLDSLKEELGNYVYDSMDLDDYLYNYVDKLMKEKLERIKEKFSKLKLELE